MRTLTLLLSFLFLSLSSSLAQGDYSANLKKTMVKVENATYSVVTMESITFSNGASIKMKYAAQAPTELVSRDKFMSIFTALSVTMIVQILKEAGVDPSTTKSVELDRIEGTADIAIRFDMSKSGLEIRITTVEGTEKETMPWKDFFGEN